MKISSVFVTLLSLLLVFLCMSAGAQNASEEMAAAAQAFLASLTPEQQKKASFDLKDEERENWHFIPKERKGLPFKELQPEQLHLAHAFLSSGLSQRGYIKATTIMSLEKVLHELEQQKGPTRDAMLYYISVFGKPGRAETWGWRVEGHHLSLNFTAAGGKVISVTPSFFGSNPGEIKEGPRKGLRVLASEEDLGRQLAKSLDEPQKRQAVYTNVAPRDVITGNSRRITPLKITGLVAASMAPPQKETLLRLIHEYVYRHRPDVAEQDLQKIQQAGFDKIRFSWAGGFEKGDGHYYCIQGPTFVMEYDNTQNNANHVHAVWRDFQNDFGEDLLRKHYQEVLHPK